MSEFGPFSENDRKWYCACNTHCEQGVFFIGVLCAALGIFSMLTGFGTIWMGVGAGGVLSGLLTLIIGVMLIMAVKDGKSGLLWPSIVVLWIDIIILGLICLAFFACGLIFLIAGAGTEHEEGQVVGITVGVSSWIFLLVLGIILVMNIWFLRIINQYRRFLNEKESADAQRSHQIASTQGDNEIFYAPAPPPYSPDEKIISK